MKLRISPGNGDELCFGSGVSRQTIAREVTPMAKFDRIAEPPRRWSTAIGEQIEAVVTRFKA